MNRLREKIVAVLAEGAADFWRIMAAMPEEKPVDVAEVLRQLRRDRVAHKKDRTWRLQAPPNHHIAPTV